MQAHRSTRGIRPKRIVFAAATAVLLLLSRPASSEEPVKKLEPGPAAASARPRSRDAADGLVEKYCKGITDKAVEQSVRVRAKQMSELTRELDQRLVAIETRIAELKAWLAKRDASSDRASSQLVGIYSAMRPEASAEKLVQLDPRTAAAILEKLDQRSAGAILNEMPADKAAMMSTIIAGSVVKWRAGACP